MNPTAILTLSERIALTLEGLCRAVAARSGRGYFSSEVLSSVIILLVWQRVRRAEGRILALLARFQAGLLRVAPARGRSAPGGGGGSRGGAPAGRLPRRLAWLLPLVPCDAANFGSQLRHLLEDPEMVALLRVSAQARRVLAPVCRMLGIEASVLMPPGVAAAEMAAAPVVVMPEVAREVGQEATEEANWVAGLGDPPWISGKPEQRLARSFDRGLRCIIG